MAEPALVERFGVVCIGCGSWRVYVSVQAFRDADGELHVAPVFTCIVCQARQVFDEQLAKTVVV